VVETEVEASLTDLTRPTPAAKRTMQRELAERLSSVLRVLGEPFRVQVVSALATAPQGWVSAGEIASISDLRGPTVSHHLRSLREAGVVVAERHGTSIHYALAPGMSPVITHLLSVLATAALRSDHPQLHADGDGTMSESHGHAGPALLDAEAALARAAEALSRRFPGLEPALVERVLRDSYASLARTARVTQHLPVLAERFASQRLADIQRAGAGDGATGHPVHVLFVCVANAGRSQLAAALLRRHADDAVVVRSAGSLPADEVHASVQPLLTEILGYVGIDDDDAPFPKPLTDDAVRAADVVITMGCGDTCPVLPGKRYEDWAVGDPALASPEGVRAILAEIDVRVRALADQLLTAAPTTQETV
jgi:ArsR family transcriptional regulator